MNMDKDERTLRDALRRMKETKPDETICLNGKQCKLIIDRIAELEHPYRVKFTEGN